jgi:hypothetical protein
VPKVVEELLLDVRTKLRTHLRGFTEGQANALSTPTNGHADQLRATAATVLRCAPASAARSLPCPTKHAVARQLHSLVGRRATTRGT